MARLAQRLQVLFCVRSPIGEGQDVIDFGGGRDPPLSFAVNAQGMAGELHRAYLLPSLVVAAVGWCGTRRLGRPVGLAPRPLSDNRRAARRPARPTYPGRHTSNNRHTPDSLCSGNTRQVRSSMR